MTDYQFKAIMTMILQIVDKSDDKEEIKRKIKEIIGDKNKEDK